MRIAGLIDEFKKSGKPDKPVLLSLIYRVVGLFLIFLLQVLLARLMGPKNYGDYTVIITVLNLLLVVSLFGFDSSVLRFLPSAIEKNENGNAFGFIKFSYRVIMVAALICSVLLFIFLLVYSKKFNIAFSEGLFWGVFLLPIMAFSFQAGSILRALRMTKLSLMPAYFLFPVFMAASCWYYFTTYNKLSVDAAMLINLGVSTVVCIFINRRAGKNVKKVLPEQEAVFNPKLWMSVSSILLLTSLLDLLLKQSDILMVGYFLGNTKAGIYAVAAKLATLAALGLSVADYVIMPKIAALYETKQFISLQKKIRTASFQILSISLPVILLLLIFGKPILTFFGSAYSEAYCPLVILLVGQLINAGTGMVGGLMTMTGHQRQFLVFYFVAIVIQFLLNALFIKLFGILGASIGTSIALIFLNICAYQFVKLKLKIRAGIL